MPQVNSFQGRSSATTAYPPQHAGTRKPPASSPSRSNIPKPSGCGIPKPTGCKPPLILPKPQLGGAGKSPNSPKKASKLTTKSAGKPADAYRSQKQTPSNGVAYGRSSDGMADVLMQLQTKESQLLEQRQATDAANKKLEDSEAACRNLQSRIDAFEGEQNSLAVVSLTDDQRGDIVQAEAKVKQLQDTVMSLSNRLCLVTTINEEMDDNSKSDDLSEANKKIRLLLKQVDSEFKKRRVIEKQATTLRSELSQHTERADTPQRLPNFLMTENESHPAASTGMPGYEALIRLQEKCAIAERKLAEAEQQVASITSQFSDLERQAQQLRAERDAVQKKVEETEAIFEELSTEKEVALEECRRAQVNTRAAQMDTRSAQMDKLSLLKELDTLRSTVQEECTRTKEKHSVLEAAQAALAKARSDLDASKLKTKHLESQLTEFEEVSQLLEQHKTIATSCQQAVEDITERCQQLESEKEALQAELTARQERIIQLTEGGAESSKRPSARGADDALTRRIDKHRHMHSQQSDQVKVELWRLQKENVELRQRIYQQLVGRDHSDDLEQQDHSPPTAAAVAAAVAADIDDVTDPDREERPEASTPRPRPLSDTPDLVPELHGIIKGDLKESFLADPRSRRPLLPDTSSTLSISSGAGKSHGGVSKDDDALSLASTAHDIQSVFMVDLHMGSRKDKNSTEEEEAERRETNESVQMVEQLLDNLAAVRFWGSADVEEHVKKLCVSHQRLHRQLEDCRSRLQSSESNLQKNQRALVRSVSGKRAADKRPRVTVRDRNRGEKANDSASGGEDRASSNGTSGPASAISLSDYETTVKTLSEKIDELRNVGEGVQSAKARVEQALLMHQRREQEIQRMLQNEINNLRRLNLKLANEKVEAPQAAVIVEMIHQTQEYELALQQQDDLRTLVQDLQLALLQKEQTISALEWKMADAQADITVLHAERDCQLRQLQHARLNSAGASARPGSGAASTAVPSPATPTASITEYRKVLASLRVPGSAGHGIAATEHTRTLREMRSKSTSSGSSLPEDRRSLSESSLDTMVFKDGVITSSPIKRSWPPDGNDGGKMLPGSRTGKWSSTSGLPSEMSTRHDNPRSSPPAVSAFVTGLPPARPHPKVMKKSSLPNDFMLAPERFVPVAVERSTVGVGDDPLAMYSRPRPHSVPVERQGSADEMTTSTLRPAKVQPGDIEVTAKELTRGLKALMANDDDGKGETASRTVDEAHEMVRRTLEAAHGTAWQVIVHASELSESATRFSNADSCQPIYGNRSSQTYSPPSGLSAPAAGAAASSPGRPGHRRNYSEGNLQSLQAKLALAAAANGGGESKDNTWKRIKRGDTPSTPGSRPGVLSPSGEASAFDKWTRVKGKLEASVPQHKLEGVGTGTWETVSTLSSTGLSLNTTSSYSPNTTTEDTDSATDSFSGFPQAAFRHYANANGKRSVSPTANFRSPDPGQLNGSGLPGPKIVAVKVLDSRTPSTTESERSSKHTQLPSDSAHGFRPVSAIDDNSDTQSIVSTGTVVCQEPIAYDTVRLPPKEALNERQMRRRSTSDVNAIVPFCVVDRAPHSKTPPSSFTQSVTRPHPTVERTRSSKTPDSSTSVAIAPVTTATSSAGNGSSLSVASSAVTAESVQQQATTTSSSSSISMSVAGEHGNSSNNTNSSGKPRSSSWLGKFSGRRNGHDSDTLTKTASNTSSTLDRNTGSQKNSKITASASVAAIHVTSKKDGSLKARKDGKASNGRHAITNVEESAAQVPPLATGYSPSVPLAHSVTNSSPYTPKPASPHAASADWTGSLNQRSGSQVLRTSTNRLSMVEMEPFSVPKPTTKDKGRRGQKEKGTIC